MVLERIRQKAKELHKKVIFPDSEDERVLKATSLIIKQKIARVVLLGNAEKINKKAKELGVSIDEAEIIDSADSDKLKKYAEEFYEIRKQKGINYDKALEIVKEPIYFGMMMLKSGEADALVSGAINPTSHTLKPAFQLLKGKSKASCSMLMQIEGKNYLFADCSVQAHPDAEDLADIAIESAKTFEKLTQEKSKVAMLSFSTKGSASHATVDKVKKAYEIAKEKNHDLVIDGELQLDAAIVPWIAKKKNPDGAIKGDANVLIFPNLDAANIGYKLVERFFNAKAIGPLIQGLTMPVNDLSRGCSVEDIIDITAVSVLE